MAIERNPAPRIRAWLDRDDNWERAEGESFRQIAREIGIAPNTVAYWLRLILKAELGFETYAGLDAYREEKKRLRRERIQERKRAERRFQL